MPRSCPPEPRPGGPAPEPQPGGPEPEPELLILDARADGCDEAGLRAAARERCTRSRAAHSSRSYRWPLALVALWQAPVGVDVERVGEADRAFADSICTPAERHELGERRFSPLVCAELWSGKEALAKALGDPLAYDPRRLEAPLLWPGGASGRWRARALDVGSGHVAWLCWAVGV